MDDGWSITSWFVATRAVHFAACLLLFGTCAFDRVIVGNLLRLSASELRWRSIVRRILVIALAVAWVSGASWFVLVTMQMSGLPPRAAVRSDVMALVWGQTQFGLLWRIRAVILAAITALVVVKNPRTSFIWTILLLSGFLAASLAWAGHGQTNGPIAWHLTADILHILVAGLWPVGLLPLMLLLRIAHQLGPALSILVRRFSAVSLGSVALLAATGLANGLFLVGSWRNLIETTYGHVLLVKVALFCIAVSIGAVNLLHLKPRLAVSADQRIPASLRRNVALEVALTSGVILVVGLLGLLPPPAEAMPHMHHSHDEAAGPISRAIPPEILATIEPGEAARSF